MVRQSNNCLDPVNNPLPTNNTRGDNTNNPSGRNTNSRRTQRNVLDTFGKRTICIKVTYANQYNTTLTPP